MKNYWLSIKASQISLIRREDKKIFIHFESGPIFYYYEKLNEIGDYVLAYGIHYPSIEIMQKSSGKTT